MWDSGSQAASNIIGPVQISTEDKNVRMGAMRKKMDENALKDLEEMDKSEGSQQKAKKPLMLASRQ